MKRQLVVIGAGLGGLSAAIYARLQGYDVLVVEQASCVGGKAAGVEIGGYHLDPGPSIIILLKIYEDVFKAAGRRMQDYLTFKRLDTLSRVFFQGQEPIDLPADEQQCVRLLNDLSPQDGKALEALLAKLGKIEPLLNETVYKHSYTHPIQLADPRLLRFGMTFNPIRQYKELVDELFQLPLMKAFFYGFPSYGGQTYFAKSPGAFLIPYYMIREGVYFPTGGVRSIPEAFRKLAQELGVEFRLDSKVTGVNGQSDRMTSVEIDGGETLEASAFISNLDRFTFESLRGTPMDHEPSFSYFTIHWGIRRKFPALRHHNLVIPASFEIGFDDLYRLVRFPQEPIVYLNSPKDLDSEAAPSGSSNLFAVVTCPAMTKGIDWPKVTEDCKVRVIKILRGAGIVWDESDVDFERVQTPPYFQAEHGSYRGSLYGLQESNRLWGMFPASNRDSRWKNLAFCGGSVQPGAGLPMVVLSGRFAVAMLPR